MNVVIQLMEISRSRRMSISPTAELQCSANFYGTLSILANKKKKCKVPLWNCF